MFSVALLVCCGYVGARGLLGLPGWYHLEAFNLPATLELVVELEPLTKGASNTNYYPVGFKDGHYLITLMAPKP